MAGRKRIYGVFAYGLLIAMAAGGGYSLAYFFTAKQATIKFDEMTSELKSATETAQQRADRIEQLEKQVSKLQSATSQLTSSMQSQNRAISGKLEGLEESLKGAGAKWIRNPRNGHYYAATPFPLPWRMAREWAQQHGGYLVVINNEAENKWLAENFDSDVQYWIGLSDEHEEGKWQWVDGSEPEYTNWQAGEPDNYRQSQHYVIMNYKVPAKNLTEPGFWNDIAIEEQRLAIIEKNR